MAIAANLLKKEIKKEFGEITKKLDHDVDCIVEDLRKGKGAGLNIKKTQEYIEKAEKAIEIILFVRDNADRVKKATEATTITSEATEKSSVIASALNPAAAAIGFATRFIVEKLKQEVKDLDNVIEVVPALTKNFSDFLQRSRRKITVALVEKALKDKVAKDRTNMIG
tara:strand:+ start:1583 stop:2086 length:504 start_codon:yes stop_codon:yes gene_type:complete